MIILDGKNLGERQQQLNNKVNDAAKHKVNFNEVKDQDEKSDVDKFFKIDLAAKYKNVDYILEILKCGDPLHISRALDKCSWLYDIDLKHIINNDYLSENIFPLMSIKMRNKLLTAIATNMKSNDTRALEFCAYCMKMKLYNVAVKFLIHTPESFKLEVILKKTKVFYMITGKEGEFLKNFIGDSFELAENYVKNLEFSTQKSKAVYLLRYMYLLSNEKYLDMLEICDGSVYAVGRRLSKHIIQNHKLRVMKKPFLYAYALNKDIIKRNIKIEEAKIFAVALLPDKPARFFHSNYYAMNKFVLDLIPAEERFAFIKKIFIEKYKDEPFEMSYSFYSNNCFEMMTVCERESWALQNIASQNEILGSGNDYKWYEFITFEKAFNDLRKEIIKTTENTKRCEMLKILLDSSKNEEDLVKLLTYFYDRHRNEVSYVIERFLSKLIEKYKVWHFGENCWKALEKIFYNIEVFDKSKYNSCDSDYRVLALLYFVINEKPVPEVLNEYLEMNVISFYTLKNYIKKSKNETDKMFQYISQYYTEKLESMSSIQYDKDAKKKIRKYLRCTLDMAEYFGKTKEDLPEIVLTHVKQDWDEFGNHTLLAGNKLSSSDIMHYLKKDATLVVTKFPEIKSYCESKREYINWLVHKLKVYFSHDLSEKYITLFNKYLSAGESHYITVEIAVRGIIILADCNRKIDFLEKYTPTDKTMDKATMCTNTLDIQRAVCRHMLCSRPPLPLAKVFQYVTGDYVKYCLVLFRSFLVNLPQSQCLEFVQKMINSPTSIQKHGLRLAFECVEAEKLQVIILQSWNKTKSVSLRTVLYTQLTKKVSDESGDTQLKLFDVLITLTLDLNEDDDEPFKLAERIKLLDHLVGRYLEAAWNAVSKLSEKRQNLERMVAILKHIDRKICLVPEKCVDKIINDHVHFMLNEGQILNKLKQGYDYLFESKWDVTISSLAYVVNEKKLEKNVALAKHILKKCFEMWDKLDNSGNLLVVRKFLNEFITELDNKSYDYTKESDSHVVTLMQVIEQDIAKALPEKEIYQLVWKLRSNVVTKTVILGLNLCLETLKHDDIKEAGIKLGKDFGMLIKKYVEEGKFYRILNEQIKRIIIASVDNFFRFINRPDFCSFMDVRILFCLGLLQHEIFETYMLALDILPSEYNNKFLDEYLSAVKKIQGDENKEIQYYVYEKFVNTDFKKMKLY